MGNQNKKSSQTYSAKRISKKYRVLGHLLLVILFALIMYAFNNLIRWEAQVINTDWSKVLPVINISLGLTILAQLIFIFYDPRKFQSVIRIILDIFSFIVLYRLFAVYPFRFELFFEQAWLNVGFKIFLPFVMAVTIIAVIIRLIKIIEK
jgi:hypothetical protein